ncbi:MAG TPA: peptidase M23, partial [Prevotellaceae bacterium]|nr:peptidase M23 [Prevotellaceae bacterium]
NNLSVLNGQIEKQEKSIKDMQFRIDSIQHHVNRLSGELRKLNKQLDEKKDKYKRSMLYLYNNRKSQNKLLFILSADNFSQMLRRYRYTREYAKYQRVQGMLIQKKEEQVHKVQSELLRSKSKHSQALGKQQAEKEKLVTQQDQQKKTVKQLQGQQKQLQNVLAQNKKEMTRLNGKIDYFVQQAIEQERKRREAEERKRREEERKKRQASEKKNITAENSRSRKGKAQKDSRRSEPMPEYRESSKEYKLGQSFSSNRGKLPVPVTG